MSAAPRPQFTLTLLDGRFVVCRLAATDPVPDALLASQGFLSITRTAHELSIVCAEEYAPAAADARRWRGLEVEGPLPFGTVGVIAELSRVLAEAGVSLLAIATHDTDYLFVDAADLPAAVRALRRSGHRLVAADAGPPIARS